MNAEIIKNMNLERFFKEENIENTSLPGSDLGQVFDCIYYNTL